jgi:hypothetical protein
LQKSLAAGVKDLVGAGMDAEEAKSLVTMIAYAEVGKLVGSK